MSKIQKLTFLLASIVMFDPDSLFAYVGPGPGLNFVYSLLGLLGAIFTSIVFIIVWAFKNLFRKNKKKDQK